MKKTSLFIILILSTASFAQTEADSINQIVDSLFILATTKNINYQDQVQPAKEALGEMRETAVPRLVEKMDTQDARSMHALVAIFKLIGRSAVPYIVDALDEKDPFKRRLAARALGDMKDSTAVDGLLNFTGDPDYRIRAGTVVALGKIGDPRGINAAMNALNDDDYLVRLNAATALSMFADPATIDILINALSDSYYGVRYKAAHALGNIGEQSVAPIKSALSSSESKTAFYLVIEIAGNLKDKKLIKPLSEILKSDDPLARAFVVEALDKFESNKAKKTLRKLQDKETHPFVVGKLAGIKSE
ncbi:MAG: HEAT repeat domain-containing protein [candidate division Zixibacteria bacterium]